MVFSFSMDQIVLEPERSILDAWSRRQKFAFRFHSPGSNYCEFCPWLYLQVFKAGCKLVSLSRMGFPPVVFMSRRLRYLLRMCSTWLKFAQQHI